MRSNAITRRAVLGLMGAATAAMLTLATGAALALETAGRVVTATVMGSGLAGSRTGTDPARAVRVYLPPGYADGDARYPVLYLLHGFGGSGAQWTERQDGWSIATALDREIAAGRVPPVIVVMPDAQVPLIGSMYVNSPMSGAWEDFIARDLVAWADATWRTRPTPAARAVAGHSMGGYGALNAAVRHPDVFGATYGISPCCLDWGKDLGTDNPRAFGPDARFADLAAFQGKPLSYPHLAFAIAAAWTPAADAFQPRTPAIIAADGSVTTDPAVKELWQARMPVHTAAADLAAWKRLKVGLEVGSADEYAHILDGTRALSAVLTRHGVPHRFVEHAHRHNDRLTERVETGLLPFLAHAFAE